jgi:thiol:disulfide interchange protein DsbD
MELIWLTGAEAFLLAGIFTRERLFRGFGLIISFVVALEVMPTRIAPLIEEIFNGQPHYHAQLSIVLAVIAVALYANAHVVRRIWPDLFRDELEQTAGSVLSFMASIFAVSAVYAFVGDTSIAIALALLVFALSLLGKQFSIDELVYQAHWIAVVAIVQVIVIGRTLEAHWLGVPERIWTFGSVAALLYVSSRFVRLSNTGAKAVFAAGYGWAATSLLAIMIWFQSPDWSMTLLWLGLGLALPYLLLTLFPAWRRFLPRPGAWMKRLEELLAFPLYASVAWLVWVLSQQAGPTGVAVALGGLVLIGLAAWLFQASRGTLPLPDIHSGKTASSST